MKGLGVFSPSNATSRYILVASGVYESTGNCTPKSENNDISLNLLEFNITERAAQTADPFTQFDNTTNYGHFGNDAVFPVHGNDFGSYLGSISSNGIADFSVLHSLPLCVPEGNVTALRWIEDGLLAVGSTSGDVFLLNGHSLVDGTTPETLSTAKVCNVAISCLGYNPKTSMLGVAGVDGQISVCNLADVANLSVLDISYGKWKVGLVTGLSWNDRLGHILATSGASLSPADSSGLVVWDLKARKPASSFRDPSGRVNPVAIDWVPEQPTQLIVGYGDDNAPALQLWDLRNCAVPVKEVKGHTRGLTDLKFSPHDPSLLLTSGKDDCTKCWTLNSPNGPFELVSSIQTEALSHHCRVEWHPHVPGLFLAQSTDGENSIHHIFSDSLAESYIPVWVKRKRGVISGFAGSVSTWTSAGDIKCYTLGTQFDDETCEILDNSLTVLQELQDPSAFQDVCREKINESSSEFDSLTWGVLQSLYNNDMPSLISLLGYETSVHEEEEVVEPEEDKPVGAASADDDVEEFFNSLTIRQEDEKFVQEPQHVPKDTSISWGSDELKRSLVVGNYKEAAETCIRDGKVTEALLLAYVGGPDLCYHVTNSIVEKSNDPFVRAVFLIMQGDILKLVENSDLNAWKETLCYLCTYSSTLPNFKELCNALGDRLSQSRDKNHLLAASICYICGGNHDGVVDIWNQVESRKNSIQILVDNVIKMAALAASGDASSKGDAFGRSIALLAEIFVDAGHLEKAMRCLSLPGVSNSSHIANLRARIEGCVTPQPAPKQSVHAGSHANTNVTHVVHQTAAQPSVPRDVGTAPGAVAGAVNPGMPIPWPLPTATQQLQSTTKSTQESNRLVIASATGNNGEQMSHSDLELVNNTLWSLIPQGDTSRMAEENRRHLDALMLLLKNAQLSGEANSLLSSMCRAIQAGDRVNSNIVLSTIISKLWNNTNKNWIMCLKRIVPK